MPADLSLAEARRIALTAQGLGGPRPARVTANHLRRVIRQLSVVQIDYVNVLVPAHYFVFFSRLGPYRRALLDEVVHGAKGHREFTEQWAHEASILPVETWPLLRHRMAEHRPRPWGFERFLAKHADYVQRVLDEVRVRGPLAADDLLEMELGPDVERSPFARGGLRTIVPGSWVGSVQRAVLEAHFGRGLLASAHRRRNFARAYDLAERLIPPQHHGRKVEREDAERELIRLAARAYGVATANDLADYYRMPVRTTRARLQELVSAGELDEARVEGWRETAYLHPAASAPGKVEAATLLCPFDPLIWYRPRVARLFGFDYRVEIFVPQPKRRWGYYVLPFLLGDRLVARVDLKADRDGCRLLVPAAYLEASIKKGKSAGGPSPAKIATALAHELNTLAAWLDLEAVVVEPRGDFARPLAAALRTK